MARTLGRLLAVMGILAGAVRVLAEDPTPGIVTTLPRPAELPPPDATPAPLPNILPVPAPDPFAAPPAPMFWRPCGPERGLTAAVEFGILFPHLKNALVSPVIVLPAGFVDTVAPPDAPLEGTVALRITLGWRLRDGLGAVLVSYRNLASEGYENLPGFDAFGDGLLRSRIDVNFVDLAYSTREMPLGALWGLRWEVGTRLMAAYFDSQAQGLVLGQRSSNHFLGAGPQVALDLTREIPDTGLALFARTDAAAILGRVQQRFAESIGDPNNPLMFGGVTQHGSQAVPHVIFQAGLSWLSHPDGRFRVTCGYHWEQVWALGTIGASRGDIRAQGLFLRSEFNF